MIRIISGVYGCRGDNGGMVAKGVKDLPFSLPLDEEARLVTRGVAEYVGEGDYQVLTEATSYELCNIEMPRAELDKIAEGFGLNTKRLNSKAEVIAAINEAAQLPNPDDEQPNLDTADIVTR